MLTETIRPNLNGLEVNYPIIEGQDIEIRLPPKSDNIIILRRNADQCSYGLAYRTHQREYTDFEMIQLAKDSAEASMFGDANAFFKLYNDQYGAVFYIENREQLPLETTFDLDMENMAIKGEAEDKKQFVVKLGPGETTSRVLKTVDPNKGNSLAMSYSYSFDE